MRPRAGRSGRGAPGGVAPGAARLPGALRPRREDAESGQRDDEQRDAGDRGARADSDERGPVAAQLRWL